MWISFYCLTGKRFAIRPYVGGVNGVSGESSLGNMGLLLRRLNSKDRKQDYLVSPEQIWLDGIANSPGIVRQFVATEMAPPRRQKSSPSSGATRSPGTTNRRDNRSRTHGGDSDDEGPVGSSIEWQMTGRDEVGGLQLQIIPEFDVTLIHAGSMKNVCKDSQVAIFSRPASPQSRLVPASTTSWHLPMSLDSRLATTSTSRI